MIVSGFLVLVLVAIFIISNENDLTNGQNEIYQEIKSGSRGEKLKEEIINNKESIEIKKVKVNTPKTNFSFEIPEDWVSKKWHEEYEILSIEERREFLEYNFDFDASSLIEEELNESPETFPVVSVAGNSSKTIYPFITINWGQLDFYLKSFNSEGSFRNKELFGGSYLKWEKKKIGSKTVYFEPSEDSPEVGVGEYVIELGNSDLLQIKTGPVTTGDDPQKEKIVQDYKNKIERIIETLKIEGQLELGEEFYPQKEMSGYMKKFKLVYVFGGPDDINEDCAAHLYDGELKVGGWYSIEERYDHEYWMFNMEYYYDENGERNNFNWDDIEKQVLLKDANDELEEKLKKASKEKPMEIIIKGIYGHCEGLSVSIAPASEADIERIKGDYERRKNE